MEVFVLVELRLYLKKLVNVDEINVFIRAGVHMDTSGWGQVCSFQGTSQSNQNFIFWKDLAKQLKQATLEDLPQQPKQTNLGDLKILQSEKFSLNKIGGNFM
eukprot:TRINITY_DN453_c0_g1_i3.p9 TRINITY_DN453_c0_g1~~TRINITY_DN453_c0_g1_i3.p9  ORF type:complete len:102 (-),score=10.53 TRINITY_DN453_c0_g1_i3:920-1225(-)